MLRKLDDLQVNVGRDRAVVVQSFRGSSGFIWADEHVCRGDRKGSG